VQCESGAYYDGLICHLCEIGRYSVVVDHEPYPRNCTLCPSGQYNTKTGRTECTECAYGKYSSSDRSYCGDCDAGQYINASAANPKCADCEAGKYAPQALTGGCLECAAGFYTDNATKATLCTSCDAGKYSHQYSTECTLCPKGRFSSTSAESCTECSSGFYASSVGSSTCTACSAGSYASKDGSQNCSSCAPGRYQGSTGQTSCKNCEAGKAAASWSTDSCSTCSLGASSFAGSSVCSVADSGYYISQKTGQSEKCPSHSTCAGGLYTPIPYDGYWVDHSDQAYAGVIYPCSRATCYPTNTNGSCWKVKTFNASQCNRDDLQCIEGSGGPLCGSCLEGYVYRSAINKCTTCKSSQGLLFAVITLFSVAVLLAIVLFEVNRRFKLIKKVRKALEVFSFVDGGSLKVIWVTYQIIVSASFTLNVTVSSVVFFAT
jgi:hypothetical protein